MDSVQFIKCPSILAYSGVIVYNIEVSNPSIMPLGITEKFESPAMTAQATIKAKVFKYTALLCECLEKNSNRRYPNGEGFRFNIKTGRKYHKIVEGEGTAHAFVDKNTGEVYKPASWSSPAKGVRFDLRIIKEREWLYENAEFTGGYLYHNAYYTGV